ncbi:hypothetical protein JL720_12241 [Aureococcus anophagefferens]|nr:hypothetical protein JL720_12241 [Aureococcus anophagefferens]
MATRRSRAGAVSRRRQRGREPRERVEGDRRLQARGTFAGDHAAFVQLLQVVAHPKVGAVAIAKPGDKAEGDEGEEKAENSRVGVRNHAADAGTASA